MSELDNQNGYQGYNRRDFLRGGSMAAVMAMMGGVELAAQTTNAPAASANALPKVKVAVIGLGAWGREIVNTLMRLPQAEVAAVCDNYAAFLKRGGALAPSAKAVADYKEILGDKDIAAVVIATPTHLHKQVVLESIKAGKHVYCEAPLANTIEDARAIALAAKTAPDLVFQAGFQLRSDPQRHFLLPFIRSGALGKNIVARAQWHKKQSWRASSPNPAREKEMNWRLDKELSTGLVGELGSHSIDQAMWYLNARPVAINGYGGILFWKDGREIPDTVQVVIEFPGGVNMLYDATLANSFDGNYELIYGSDSAVLMRDSKAWLFKEVDAPLLGWEVYARKDTFGAETGIALVAGASKMKSDKPVEILPFTNTPLWFALGNFLRSSSDVSIARKDFVDSFGADDPDSLKEHLAKTARQPGSTWQEGYEATIIGIKAHEAIATGKKAALTPDLYELT